MFLDRLVSLSSRQGLDVAVSAADRRVLYRDLPALVMDAAARLHAGGVGPGRVVAITVADETEHLILALALLALGAWQVNTASHESDATRADLALRTGADLHLTDCPHITIANLPQILWTPGIAPSGARAVQPQGGGGAFFSTSGTTGRQSIVKMDEAMLVRQAKRNYLQPSDRFFKAASMEFGHSKRNRLFAVWTGSQNMFRPPRDPATLSAWLAASGTNVADVSRVNLTGMLSDGASTLPADLALRAEGSAIPLELRKAITAQVTPNLHIRYASTETGLISIAGPQDHDINGALGHPQHDVEIMIASAEGAPLPPDEIGEICLRTPGMVLGYFDDPAKTAQRFRDGWFLPGDMGKLMPDGQLVMVGRKDDVINLSGIKIFPVEVERALASHPDVTAVAVFPIPSSVHGQIPVAVVELRPEAMDRQADILLSLMQSARAELGIRAPRKVLACETLPRNAMGKIVTRELLPLFERQT